MKTRFAPSPTGYIHLGNARTALFNFLLTKAHTGHFLLRIEDSDASRSLDALSAQVQTDLMWLGLVWDEGPGKEVGQGPYFQSQRQVIYNYYYQQLEEIGRAYPCFCSEQDLLLMRKRQLAQGKPPRYTGICRHLTAEQVAERKTQNKPYTLRFHVLPAQTLRFIDLVKGEQRFSTDDMGDFIIQRSDGAAAFFFCNAIDDALMKVTHVLRGEDHLTNTPRQIMILQALSLPIPLYGHMSMIVGDDGTPLSKRNGSFSIKALCELGYFPSAIQNYLARLGHTYANAEFMDLSTLSKYFSIERLGKSPARYDASQLIYWQKQALLHCNDQEISHWLGKEVTDHIPVLAKADFIALMRSNISFPEEALPWVQCLFSKLTLTEEAKTFLQQVPSAFWTLALDLMEQPFHYESFIKALQAGLNIKGKNLFAPLRMALTGRLDGPELKKIIHLMGDERMQERLLYAKDL